MKWSLRSWLTVVSVVCLSLVPPALATSASGATTHASCRVPRMTGLTVKGARSRAAVAGCTLRLIGATVTMPTVQTIHTQSVRPGRRARVVVDRVNPVCPGSAALGPPPGEPLLKPGPTELIAGLFGEGGPLLFRSAPNCKSLVGTSSPGTITVVNAEGTVVVNKMALATGQLLHADVPAGTYTLTGVLKGGTKVGPLTVKVPSGEIVRQDLVIDFP